MKRSIFYYNYFISALLIAYSNAQESTRFQITDKGYEREMKYSKLQYEDYSEFINKFNRDFFYDEENLNKTTLDDVKQYIRSGVMAFQTSLAGYENFKTEQQKRNNVSTKYTEPLYMPDVSCTLKSADDNVASQTLVNFYDVKLYGLVYINATDLESMSVDADYLALFYMKAHSATELINICGRHSIKVNEESVHGSFCYEIVNVKYENRCDKVRTSTGDVKTTAIKEELIFDVENYTDIIFSIAFNKWDELQSIHSKALKSAIAEHYLLSVSKRFRTVVETNADYIEEQVYFIHMYQQRVLETIGEFIRLYLRAFGQTFELTTDNGDQLRLANISKFSDVYSEINIVDSRTRDIETKIFYRDSDSDTAILYKNVRYVIQTATLKFTVQLASVSNADTLSNVDIKYVTFNFGVNDPTEISDAAKHVIKSTMTKKMADFVTEIITKEFRGNEIISKH